MVDLSGNNKNTPKPVSEHDRECRLVFAICVAIPALIGIQVLVMPKDELYSEAIEYRKTPELTQDQKLLGCRVNAVFAPPSFAPAGLMGFNIRCPKIAPPQYP